MQVLWVASILQTSSHAETLCGCHVGFYLIMKRLLLDLTKGVMNKGFVVSDFDDACPFPFLSILLAKTSTLLCEVQEEKKLPKKHKKRRGFWYIGKYGAVMSLLAHYASGFICTWYVSRISSSSC